MINKAKKVLTVEDDESLRNVLSGHLAGEGFDVLKAGDGQEALELILQEKPDLVLLDLLLPKLDGFQLLKRIREYPDTEIKNTAVIILSNLWSNKDLLAAQALRVEEYFVKANTSLDDVYKKVREVMVKKAASMQPTKQ